jgi:hypothetical protein
MTASVFQRKRKTLERITRTAPGGTSPARSSPSLSTYLPREMAMNLFCRFIALTVKIDLFVAWVTASVSGGQHASTRARIIRRSQCRKRDAT